MKQIILVGIVNPDSEDNNMAQIAEISDDNEEHCFFVRLHSYDENKEHTVMNHLKNKKVRITVEIIED